MRTIVTALIVGASLSGVAQGTFQNLDFESTDIPVGTPTASFVPISEALPGWSGYLK